MDLSKYMQPSDSDVKLESARPSFLQTELDAKTVQIGKLQEQLANKDSELSK